jgi:putative protease
MNLPELLAPAGDLQKAYTAFRYGADAVYCGLPMLSLRTRMNSFTEENIREIVDFANKNNKKVYVVINGFPHQHMIPVLKKHLEFLAEVKPHGLIIADAGVLSLANEITPHVEKHLSVQSSTVNVPAMEFWQKNGVTRVILAREIAIAEVEKIHALLPSLELEYFIHGAVCMAYSGRCLLSNFMASRDSNRGACAHSCRWNYRVFDDNGYEIDTTDRECSVSCSLGKPKNIHDLEKVGYAEEELRKNEFIALEEDFHGTHIMSSRDMCMIEFLQEIIDAGVVSLKIEGRNKTEYYLATVVRAYREALSNIAEGKPFDPSLWKEIHATANRGFFAGFLHGKPHQEGQQYESNASDSTHLFVGEVLSYENSRVTFEVKNRIDEGDTIECIFPERKDDVQFLAKDLIKNDEKVASLHGGAGIGSMACETLLLPGTLLRKKIRDK